MLNHSICTTRTKTFTARISHIQERSSDITHMAIQQCTETIAWMVGLPSLCCYPNNCVEYAESSPMHVWPKWLDAGCGNCRLSSNPLYHCLHTINSGALLRTKCRGTDVSSIITSRGFCALGVFVRQLENLAPCRENGPTKVKCTCSSVARSQTLAKVDTWIRKIYPCQAHDDRTIYIIYQYGKQLSDDLSALYILP